MPYAYAQQMFCLLVNWSIWIHFSKLVFKHVMHAIMSTILNPDHVLNIDLLHGSLKLALIQNHYSNRDCGGGVGEYQS